MMTVAEQLTVHEVGERFATMSPSGEAFVYEVAWDGHAYVAGYLPAPPNATGEGGVVSAHVPASEIETSPITTREDTP